MTLITLSQKIVISAEPESKVPIKMLFPYRYNKWFLKQLDSLDHGGKVLTEEKVEYGSNLLPQEYRLCTFSFNSHKLSKMAIQLKIDLF